MTTAADGLAWLWHLASLVSAKPPWLEEAKLLISVHFPKAAGTNMRRMLERHFGKALMVHYSDAPLHPASRRNLAPQLRRAVPPRVYPGVRAIHGHFRGDAFQDLRVSFRFTFLREPVSNLISIYFYWLGLKRGDHPIHNLFLDEKLSILELAQVPIMHTMMSNAFFGDVDMNDFDFIRFHDRREPDMERLSAITGIEMDASLSLNRMPDCLLEQRQAILQNERLMGALRNELSEDVLFYEKIRALRA